MMLPFMFNTQLCCYFLLKKKQTNNGTSSYLTTEKLTYAFQGYQSGRVNSVQFSCPFMSDSVTPWTASCQASLSITNSQSLLKLMSIESVVLSNHLILCRPLLFLPLVFPSLRVFSSEAVFCIRWPKYWSFSFSVHPSNEYSGLISFMMDVLDQEAWDAFRVKGMKL